MLQFRNAALIGPQTYELAGLLRGQAGTEGAMRDPVPAGAPFVLIDDAVVQLAMTPADIGLPVNWKYGPAPYDIGHSAYAAATFAFTGAGLRPLSPVHIRAEQVTEGLRISWVRRTRIGGDSWEQIEIPLGEDAESYEVEIRDGTTIKRVLAAATPSVVYTIAQQTADFGAPQPNYILCIYQLSATYGRGEGREAIVP